jgi:hypothetical protein
LAFSFGLQGGRKKLVASKGFWRYICLKAFRLFLRAQALVSISLGGFLAKAFLGARRAFKRPNLKKIRNEIFCVKTPRSLNAS